MSTATATEQQMVQDAVDRLPPCDPEAERGVVGSVHGGRAAIALPTAQKIALFRPFPLDVFPSQIADYLTVAAASIDCDPVMVAMPALAAISAAIGNTCVAEVKKGWNESAVLWTALVCPSGTAKSPARRAAIKPIFGWQQEAVEKHNEDLETFRRGDEDYKDRLKEWKAGGMEGERPEKPTPPTLEHCYCDDVTTEAVIERLITTPRGLLIAPDELASWFKSQGQYKQGGNDVERWLSTWSAEAVKYDRKTADRKTIWVPRAFVAIAGGIQPDILRALLTAENFANGLAARFLYVMPPSRTKRWTDTTVDADTYQAYRESLNHMRALAFTVDDDGKVKPRTLPLSPQAKRLYAKFVNEHNREQSDLEGPIVAAWSKLEAYTARFALILQAASYACGVDGVGLREIDRATMEDALRLSAWWKHETRRVYAAFAENDEQRFSRKIVEVIERKGGTVTARELQRASRLVGSADQAAEILGGLVEAGVCEKRMEPPKAKGGRPVERYSLTEGLVDTTIENTEE